MTTIPLNLIALKLLDYRYYFDYMKSEVEVVWSGHRICDIFSLKFSN